MRKPIEYLKKGIALGVLVFLFGCGGPWTRVEPESCGKQTTVTLTVPEAKAPAQQGQPLPAISGLEAFPGAERVDLYWTEPDGWHNQKPWVFEVEVDDGSGFVKAHEKDVIIPAFSYFTEPGKVRKYRVRSVVRSSAGTVSASSAWSKAVSGESRALKDSDLVEEIQQASFRYFWNYRHPVSGLPREGIGGWNRNMCSVAASGMMFYNLATGIENGWITREEGLAQARKSLVFLAEKADRFHGAFPHWLHGETGATLPFSPQDDGGDLVETGFLISGALFFREYVREDPSEDAAVIRELATRLLEDVEWDWFVTQRPGGRQPLLWHWSPRHEFAVNVPIVGFNESHIIYVLALGSPTHPIEAVSYFKGWLHPGYGHPRTKMGVDLELGREPYGPPAFLTHYSYLGLDPSVFRYGSKNYLEHFHDFCRVQALWADENRPELGGGIWGMTAGMTPDGYGVQFPGSDNGTITPTGFLSSMPYAPELVRTSLENLYERYAKKLWGPFGFRDGINVERDWVSPHYIAISVGPVAPMIENEKTGLGWKALMKAPEIQKGIEAIRRGMPNQGTRLFPVFSGRPEQELKRAE